MESSFGKANHKTIESISALKLTLQEINKSLVISDNPTETLQKATFMAMQIQKLATQPQSMTPDQINRQIAVASNLWVEHKDTAVGQRYGFNNDLIFMANKQIKTNDKSMDLDSSTKAQTLFREMTGITKDLPIGFQKIAGSTQLKLNERIQEIYKDQQAVSRQQEQIRQLQRDQQKQFER